MPVKQRGASWQAAVSYKGTRLRKDFKTKEEAEDWSATTLAALRSGLVTPKPVLKVPTLGEHLEQVYEVRWKGTKSEGTTMINGRHVVRILGADRSVDTLCRDDVLKLKRALREHGNSDATINRKLAAFSVLVKEAVEWGHLEKGFKAGITKERQGRVRYLTKDEEEALLAWALDMGEDEFHAYLVVSIDTGFRQGEVLKVSKADVFEAPDPDTLWTYDTKNGKSRGVPLTDRAKEALHKLAAGRSHPNSPVFTLLPAALRERWRKAQGVMGLSAEEEFVPHIMRHTFVTRLLASGTDIKTAQDLAGHENITTTQRYAHTSPERMRLAVQRMRGHVA